MRSHQHLKTQRLYQKAVADSACFTLPSFFIHFFLPSCTYLAHHELESISIIITTVVVVVVVFVTIMITIIVVITHIIIIIYS